MEKKGQAGMGLFIGVIASVFIAGVLIMALSLVGANLITSNGFVRSGNQVVSGELQFASGVAGSTFFNLSVVNNLSSSVCSVGQVTNGSAGATIAPGNFTVSNCQLTLSTDYLFANRTWAVTYNYTSLVANNANKAINDTVVAVAGGTAFFGIMITIAAVVVLILLLVVVISSLRGGNIIGGNGKGGLNEGA